MSKITLTIPEGMRVVEDIVSSVEEIIIPDSAVSIGEGAFRRWVSLKKINIPNNITSIGYYAFEGCTYLKDITISSSVTFIGDGAFYGCTSLRNIYIHKEKGSLDLNYTEIPKKCKIYWKGEF